MVANKFDGFEWQVGSGTLWCSGPVFYIQIVWFLWNRPKRDNESARSWSGVAYWELCRRGVLDKVQMKGSPPLCERQAQGVKFSTFLSAEFPMQYPLFIFVFENNFCHFSWHSERNAIMNDVRCTKFARSHYCMEPAALHRGDFRANWIVHRNPNWVDESKLLGIRPLIISSSPQHWHLLMLFLFLLDFCCRGPVRVGVQHGLAGIVRGGYQAAWTNSRNEIKCNSRFEQSFKQKKSTQSANGYRRKQIR